MGGWHALDADFHGAAQNKHLEILLNDRVARGNAGNGVLNIIVCSLRSSGKSTFINHAIACLNGYWQQVCKEGESDESLTAGVRVITLCPTHGQVNVRGAPIINLIDIPGLPEGRTQRQYEADIRRFVRAAYDQIANVVAACDRAVGREPRRLEARIDCVPHHVLVPVAAQLIGQGLLGETILIAAKNVCAGDPGRGEKELTHSVLVTKADQLPELAQYADYIGLRCQRNDQCNVWKPIRNRYDGVLSRQTALQEVVFLGYVGNTFTGKHSVAYVQGASVNDAGISVQTDPRVILGRYALMVAVSGAVNTHREFCL